MRFLLYPERDGRLKRLSSDKGRRVIARRIADQAVLYILRERAGEAGVERFTPLSRTSEGGA